MRFVSSLAGVVTFAAFAAAASAEETANGDADSTRERAAARFRDGVAHADRGQWKEAAEAFQEAYDTLPRFDVLYNLGQSYLALDRPDDALPTLEKYLAQGGNEVPQARRSRVEKQIALLRGQVATLQFFLTPRDATLTVDGRPIARSDGSEAPAVVYALPGPHEVAATAAGHEVGKRSVAVQAGQSVILEMTLAPLPVAKAPSAGDPSSPSASATISTASRSSTSARGESRRLIYGLGAGALLLGGAAFGLYLWNDRRYDTWAATDIMLNAERGKAGWAQEQAANNELWDSIERVDWITRGLVVAAALTAATTAVLLVRRARARSEPVRPLMQPIAGGAAATLQFRW
jgi:tetratricopeptide (TPR) repeat protein